MANKKNELMLYNVKFELQNKVPKFLSMIFCFSLLEFFIHLYMYTKNVNNETGVKTSKYGFIIGSTYYLCLHGFLLFLQR